jgi:hypothetical protein
VFFAWQSMHTQHPNHCSCHHHQVVAPLLASHWAKLATLPPVGAQQQRGISNIGSQGTRVDTQFLGSPRHGGV